MGVRESDLSWEEHLVNLKARGLQHEPLLAIGDGGLGFRRALEQVFPTTYFQRCTVHMTANILGKIPESVQPQAKRTVHVIRDAPTIEEAVPAFDSYFSIFFQHLPHNALGSFRMATKGS